MLSMTTFMSPQIEYTHKIVLKIDDGLGESWLVLTPGTNDGIPRPTPMVAL